MTARLPAGKLPHDLLRALLASISLRDPSVIVGGAVGEDAAILDTGAPELLVAKTDPITFAAEDIGDYLLAVNSNDLAVCGAEPRWLLVTVLLPEGVSTDRVHQIFNSLNRACSEAGVTLVGGHTEITVGLDRPILVGCLLGIVPRGGFFRAAGSRPGDAILLAGGIALEGTAILAREHQAVLLEKGLDQAVIARAAGWLLKPGISVLPAARVLRALPGLHAMHDPTEGGLFTALHEMAEAAGLGLCVHSASVCVLPECASVCQALGLDLFGLLASGALLAALDPSGLPAALDRLHAAGIRAAHIGDFLPAAEGRILLSQGQKLPLPAFTRDELARFLESCPGG